MSQPDLHAAFRWVLLAILLGEVAGFGSLIATAKQASPETDFMRVGAAFFLGVLAMVVPLLWLLNEGWEISRYCLEHHCGWEEEPD